jgi:alpha-tubulin suppressor-like RCC1 family protein
MVSSSGSSVVLSNHNMSHQSLSSTPNSAKEKKNTHLGSYSQILGKENGGISKQDMSGVLFSMGTDNNGQLGLDILTAPEQIVSLKVLYPRMIHSLRDEVVKEICCGHSHTLITNIHGQVFSWGLNSSGQLGLGRDAP